MRLKNLVLASVATGLMLEGCASVAKKTSDSLAADLEAADQILQLRTATGWHCPKDEKLDEKISRILDVPTRWLLAEELDVDKLDHRKQ